MRAIDENCAVSGGLGAAFQDVRELELKWASAWRVPKIPLQANPAPRQLCRFCTIRQDLDLLVVIFSPSCVV